MRQIVSILGTPIDVLNGDAVLDRLEQFIEERRFHQVATANTDFLVKALHDPELRHILRTADLVMPDGMPLLWASKWLHTPLPERVTGADIVPALAKRAAEKGYTLYMLGARPDIAQTAKARLEADCPGLKIVGCVSPPVANLVNMDSATLLADIAAARPDILLVAFGNPKQEKWIHMHRNTLEVPVCIGVGGTFDFLAGAVSRAPDWMKRAGLEWFYRLSQEPKRLWKRYTEDVVHFARFLLLTLWAMRPSGRKTDFRLAEARMEDCTVLSVAGRLDASQMPAFQRLADCGLDDNTHLVLDLQAMTELDSAALGTLLNLPKRAAHVGREVRVAGLSPRIRHILDLTRTDDRLVFYPTVADALRGPLPEPLDVRREIGQGEAVLTLRGRADLLHTEPVRTALQTLPPHVAEVDVDLRGVSYLDCAMLSLLRDFADNRKQGAGQLRLIIGEAARAALRRERALDVFTLADAPRAISAAPPVALGA